MNEIRRNPVTTNERSINPDTGRPYRADRYGEIEAYDPEFVRLLVAELGISEGLAILIAATEMGGALETEAGGVRALQTYCNFLDEDESLPDSLGAREGEKSTTKALMKYFKAALAKSEISEEEIAGSSQEKSGIPYTSFADFLQRSFPKLAEGEMLPEDFDFLTDLWLMFHDPEGELNANDFIDGSLDRNYYTSKELSALEEHEDDLY